MQNEEIDAIFPDLVSSFCCTLHNNDDQTPFFTKLMLLGIEDVKREVMEKVDRRGLAREGCRFPWTGPIVSTIEHGSDSCRDSTSVTGCVNVEGLAEHRQVGAGSVFGFGAKERQRKVEKEGENENESAGHDRGNTNHAGNVFHQVVRASFGSARR